MPTRSALLLVAVAVVAGCGSSSSPTTTATSGVAVAATTAPPATTAAPVPTPAAEKQLATAGVVTAKDMAAMGGGYKIDRSNDDFKTGCLTGPADQLDPTGKATGPPVGRDDNGKSTSVTSFARVYRDEQTASQALAAIASNESIDCYGEAVAKGTTGGKASYDGSATVKYPPTGDEVQSLRSSLTATSTGTVDGEAVTGFSFDFVVFFDWVIMRTGRVVTVASFATLSKAAKPAQTQPVMTAVAARAATAQQP